MKSLVFTYRPKMASLPFLLMVAFGIGYISALDAPVFEEAKCDQDLINKMFEVGNVYGNTDEVFQKPGITWIVAATTNMPKYNNVSCLKYHTEGGGKMTVIKDNVESTVFTHEKGNRLYIPGENSNILHYKVLSDPKKGIYCGYSCSTDGPEISEKLPPNIGLTVNPCTSKADTKEALQIIEQFGYPLSKIFTCYDIQDFKC